MGRSPLAGAKVGVTGGASFIGSHLVERLVQAGATVRVIDDLSSGSLRHLDLIRDQVRFEQADLRDSHTAQKWSKGLDRVFHLANIHGGRGFIETHPGEIAQNFIIDGNVFRAAVENDVSHVTYASSACVYPIQRQIPGHPLYARYLEEEMASAEGENHANADGIYGWAKLMGETSLAAHHTQFGLSGVSCRLFTVFGPRENLSHAIMAMIARAVMKLDPYVVWGSGRQDRNFTYVDDVVEGILRASIRITDARAVNIGTDEVTSIADAAISACQEVGFQPREFVYDTTKPEGVLSRAASIKLQQELLDWTPNTLFRDGLAATVEWFKDSVDESWLRDNFERSLFER